MKELSREILEKAGIYVEEDPNETCGYKIIRYGRKAGRAKEKTWQKLSPSLNAKYHKYSGKMNWYWILGYSQNGEPKAYPLHRLVYAWFIGYVPSNMDVDHIDGDTLNNNLSNLQLLSRAENLAKRKGFKNQWDSKKAKAYKENGFEPYSETCEILQRDNYCFCCGLNETEYCPIKG